MPIKAAVYHRTTYNFDRPVNLSPNIIRLRPAAHCRTPIESYTLNIKPKNHFINWQQDPYGNFLARVVFLEQAESLSIEVELIADMSVINPFDFFLEDYAQQYPFTYPDRLKKDLQPYLEITEKGPLLLDLMQQVDQKQQPTLDFLVAVNQLVNQTLGYNTRMEVGVQSCEQTLSTKRGSCRDFAWLMVQLFRHLGLAARFVSGYSIQLKPDEKPLEGPAGVSQDVTDLHAWVEVYIPGAGWIGLDATSGLVCTEGHIPLACVPDFQNGAPIEGATDVCEVTFDFENTVKRIHEDPRVTKPYTEEQWQAINLLGEQVDQTLQSDDVRLTMGGEPTFVSIDDMEGEEWNTKADGTHKRQLAWTLTEKCRDTFGPGGIIHYAQGKWYPGEPLPRWAFNIIWRKDGEPIWENPQLLANPNVPKDISTEQAAKFLKHLAENLGLPPEYIRAAYEDVFYMLWEEGQVPIDRNPLEADLEDPLERRSLAEVLDKGLGAPLGYVLPIGWDDKMEDWQSSPWTFRRQELFLIPGNSPLGLRLPLKALPKTYEVPLQRSLFEEVTAINIRSADQLGQAKPSGNHKKVYRTAISVEVRKGNLYIFLPPLSHAEYALELLKVIEKTAGELQIPVVLEGYKPPSDIRIEKMSVTPDPGVIEVNIHPSSSWAGMVNTTDKLYELAKESRLATEKFMLDGRHTGTGGGNHITLGAAKPADSPFLRRPDLLQSMITYWQHHPSLSYLFSGAFVGPTSQAPRIDEGREDRLYEVEIAFSQVPQPNANQTPFWVVDRIFRNLLTDLTGNTHRAEFCIDKLYSPDSPTGRLGILEMRSLDMPPHKRMSLVQMLLIRSLVAWFWKKPYQHSLVRWGTSLYDKHLLPHFCWQDMSEVVEDLQKAGFPFQLQWLDPFFEFRFPRYGSVQIKDMELEVRMAIEPWHVLGEEMSNQGTARFVDSSLERVQVKLSGLTDSRFILLCNGCQIPLIATGTKGEYVAGIRYRAWQPPSALHPTIGIDAPLVFDLVDTWRDQIVGGCTYHVAHPGGRSYESFPVNAYEAESRRTNRFRDTDFTPGPIEYTPMNQRLTFFNENPPNFQESVSYQTVLGNPDFPFTLDLRLAKK